MRPQLERSIGAIGTAAIIATLWSAARPAIGQQNQIPTGYKASRTADGEPDLNGFWQALNTANWDIEEHGVRASPFPELLGAYLAQPAGFSVVEGGAIPYKPEALAIRKKHFENRLIPDPLFLENGVQDSSDPEAKCFQAGVPRGTYMPFPFQIVQTKSKILIAYEHAGAPRVVHMDIPRSALLDINSWKGQSVGQWDGETLVVDVRGFSGTTWFDRAGNFMSEKGHVVERYTAISPYHLMYEATIEDPDVFTRPWKISMPLHRRIDRNMQLLEFQCIALAEEFYYGKLKKKGS
jgi:hypothetical protein